MLALAILALAMLFFAYDLFVDAFFKGEFGSSHFIIEAFVFAAVSWTLIVNLRDLVGLRARLEQEQNRNRLLAGELATGIEEQMDAWRLTRSEKEVAWLIIKGFRFAEIADLRGVKENTTRLQASALYAKAGVSGRAEFVAEIVHQLLMPITEDELREGTAGICASATASASGGAASATDDPQEDVSTERRATRH
jgi:DNA-binding CsgD family transcriptional regulator